MFRLPAGDAGSVLHFYLRQHFPPSNYVRLVAGLTVGCVNYIPLGGKTQNHSRCLKEHYFYKEYTIYSLYRLSLKYLLNTRN